jgi:hypothetical protein
MLVGCATPATHPEMVINKPPETVQACVTQGLIARGWTVRSTNPGQVTFSRRSGSGTDYGSVATVSFLPGKVTTDVRMVTDIDTRREQSIDTRPDKTDVESAVVLCR